MRRNVSNHLLFSPASVTISSSQSAVLRVGEFQFLIYIALVSQVEAQWEASFSFYTQICLKRKKHAHCQMQHKLHGFFKGIASEFGNTEDEALTHRCHFPQALQWYLGSLSMEVYMCKLWAQGLRGVAWDLKKVTDFHQLSTFQTSLPVSGRHG